MVRELVDLISFRKPGEDELKRLSKAENFHLRIDELKGVGLFFDDLSDAIERVENLYESQYGAAKVKGRDPGHRPTRKQDPFNSFTRVFLIGGKKEGLLRGKRIGVKDNINIAGIPTTNASSLSLGYVPSSDATIISRLLEAGAVIVGKLNMDNLSFSGTSETSIFGPVKNPINPNYSPGGSSSGAGAAVVSNLVDVAIGVDQGGSARVPACCTGTVSIKPTHGLVPTYGLTYMDHTLDHICPIAKSVIDVAKTLEVIAGYDKRDPQWKSEFPRHQPKYSEALRANFKIEKIRIGLIEESISWEETDPEIKECFLSSLERLRKEGAIVEEIRIPIFLDSGAIWIATVVQSMHAMLESSGEGYWHGGEYNPEWNRYIGRTRREFADEIPPLLKCSLIAGRYLREEYNSEFYSKAQNLRNLLRDNVDAALSKFDLLATPTMIVKPPKLKKRITFSESLRRGVLLLNNTMAFNLSGHPAITFPCGVRGGFPVGLQLIGKRFDELLLFKMAKAYESTHNWKQC